MSPDKRNGGQICLCVCVWREREREMTAFGVKERLPPSGHRLRLFVNWRRVHNANI